MLSTAQFVGFIGTTDPEEARSFYRDLLGLALIDETPVALIFKCANAELRVAITPSFTPLPFTVAGWQVEDIETMAKTLAQKGHVPERFEGMEQDTRGIWTTPGGNKVLWVKDPAGNLLSLTQ